MATPKQTASGTWRVQIEVRGARDAATLPTKREAVEWAARRKVEMLAIASGRAGEVRTLEQAMQRYALGISPLKRGERAEVVRLANDTEFGLAAYFFARDVGQVFRVAEALEYGMVGINTGLISTEVAPFGGIKQSGQGREGGRQGLDDYLETKYLCLGGV